MPIWWRKIQAARHPTLLAVCVAGSVFLTGCGGTSGGVTDAVSTALKDSATAIATARLALGLDSVGKMTKAATSTALEDALKELETSRDTVARLAPTTPEDRAVRQEALTALDGCAAGITTARDAVSSDDGAPSLPDGDRALQSAAAHLSELKTKVGGT